MAYLLAVSVLALVGLLLFRAAHLLCSCFLLPFFRSWLGFRLSAFLALGSQGPALAWLALLPGLWLPVAAVAVTLALRLLSGLVLVLRPPWSLAVLLVLTRRFGQLLPRLSSFARPVLIPVPSLLAPPSSFRLWLGSRVSSSLSLLALVRLRCGSLAPSVALGPAPGVPWLWPLVWSFRCCSGSLLALLPRLWGRWLTGSRLTLPALLGSGGWRPLLPHSPPFSRGAALFLK